MRQEIPFHLGNRKAMVSPHDQRYLKMPFQFRTYVSLRFPALFSLLLLESLCISVLIHQPTYHILKWDVFCLLFHFPVAPAVGKTLCWLQLDSSCVFVFQITTLLSRLSWNLKLSKKTFLIFSVPCNNLLLPRQNYPNTGSEYLAWLHFCSSQQALRWCEGSPVLQIMS